MSDKVFVELITKPCIRNETHYSDDVTFSFNSETLAEVV